MCQWFTILAMVLLSSRLVAREAFTLRYEELPSLIQKNSLDVRAAELFAEASFARHGYPLRGRYPRLDFESGLRGVRELDGSGDSAPYFKMEGSLSLYSGRRDAIKEAVQEKESEIRKEQVALVSRDQLRLAQKLFVRLAAVRELGKAWADAMRVAEAKKKSTQMKLAAGLTTSTDLLEFELYETSLRRQKRTLDREEHELSNKLILLAGLDEDRAILLDRSFPPPSEPIDTRYKLATENHPLVKKFSLLAEQAQAGGRTLRSRWVPDVNLYASYEEYLKADQDVSRALPRRDFSTGVRLSIPLGENLAVQSESVAKGLEASAYRLQKEQTVRQLEAEYHAYRHDMAVLSDLIRSFATQMEKARKYLKQTSEEYERGVKNGPDVLEASRSLYQTQVESIQVLFDYYLVEVDLNELTQP
jgi:outer membrane protein TolC